MGGGGGGEVATGGETPNADAVGPDCQFDRVDADVADSALSIPEFDGVMVFGAETVFEDVCADAEIVEPGGDLDPFVVHGQHAIAAAGANDYAGLSLKGASGGVEGQRRLIGLGGALRAGCAIRPKEDCFLGSLSEEAEGEGQNNRSQAKRTHSSKLYNEGAACLAEIAE